MTRTIPGNHYAARKHTHENRTFLFVSSDTVVDESRGEVFPRTSLAPYLLDHLHTRTSQTTPVICTNDAGGVVKQLNDTLSTHPRWVWRSTPLRRVKRGAGKSPDSKPAISVRLQVHFCGFKRINGHSKNIYFYFIDTVSLTGRTSQSLYPEKNEIDSLRTFGERYREFCRNNGTKMLGTRGQVGAALLRDPRFIGSSSRRIPDFINKTARSHLPGNHYELRTEPGVRLQGTYLDISGAHHVAAEVTSFPDPSGIRGRGLYREPPETVAGREPWAKRGSRKFDAISRTHGLVLARASFAGKPHGSIFHPAADGASIRYTNLVYLYTNEFKLLESSGFKIEAFEAAWTSTRTSRSLNEYAKYAQGYLKNVKPEDRAWTKSLLLSTYGMLGKRPTSYQSVSNGKGREFNWPTSRGWLEGNLASSKKAHSSAATNVIALGMIQAEVRRNVIETARYLESVGVKVLALYADSLVIEGDTIPFLPPEWRVSKPLTNLVFIDKVSWIADQDERLPGRTGPNRIAPATAIADSPTYNRNRGIDWRFGTGPSWKTSDKVFRKRLSEVEEPAGEPVGT